MKSAGRKRSTSYNRGSIILYLMLTPTHKRTFEWSLNVSSLQPEMLSYHNHNVPTLQSDYSREQSNPGSFQGPPPLS